MFQLHDGLGRNAGIAAVEFLSLIGGSRGGRGSRGSRGGKAIVFVVYPSLAEPIFKTYTCKAGDRR
jgi:hypothetical protein